MSSEILWIRHLTSNKTESNCYKLGRMTNVKEVMNISNNVYFHLSINNKFRVNDLTMLTSDDKLKEYSIT
jgi:hypothetical protein